MRGISFSVSLYTAVTMFGVNEVEVGSGLVNWE